MLTLLPHVTEYFHNTEGEKVSHRAAADLSFHVTGLHSFSLNCEHVQKMFAADFL